MQRQLIVLDVPVEPGGDEPTTWDWTTWVAAGRPVHVLGYGDVRDVESDDERPVAESAGIAKGGHDDED